MKIYLKIQNILQNNDSWYNRNNSVHTHCVPRMPGTIPDTWSVLINVYRQFSKRSDTRKQKNSVLLDEENKAQGAWIAGQGHPDREKRI